MSNEPLLSFILPVYHKSAEVFERCLKSLLDQSYKNTEILAVFDGPDAELEGVVKKYPSIRSFCIEHGGAPKARNYGFAQSKGEIVSFWDADCYAKPEMAKRWVEEFNARPECVFVYSGYEFDNEQGGFESNEFDAYTLTCMNYISTMFPMRREVFPGFDESLTAAQDWDLWLTIVEKGGKGAFIYGSGFVTELPLKDSITGRGWSLDQRKHTIARIKAKHSIPNRDICIGSPNHKLKGLDLAKMLNADFSVFPSTFPHEYKMVFLLGFAFDEIHFNNAQDYCVKVQYWLPWDITAVEQISHATAKKYIEIANKNVDVHFCNDEKSKNRLAELGIKAEVLDLPSHTDDAETKLPEKFRVLFDVDDNLRPLFKDIPVDLPYIDLTFLEKNSAARIEEYSLLVSFHEFSTIDEGIRRFILNGRNIISNVQAPYCGYIDWRTDVSTFKKNLIERLRDSRTLPYNQVARDYYAERVNPDRFKEAVRSLIKPVMEVVA